MNYRKLSPAWLYETHDQATLARWARQLQYFRFVRAQGGHANDGDAFETNFTYAGRAGLLHMMEQLGMQLQPIHSDAPEPVLGQAYTADEFAAFPLRVEAFPDLAQPHHCRVAGQRVRVWIGQTIRLRVLGEQNPYDVTEADFTACLAVEAYFDYLGWQSYLDRSPDASGQCVSPVHYPELFQ